MTKALVKKPIDKLKAMIEQPTVQAQFKNALGKHSDLFVASLIDVFGSGLQKCDPGSVIQEALKAAVLKLPISKDLGFAYLVPYGGKAQFQIGYKGMIQLAMRSGQVKNLNAGVVYEGEFVKADRLTGTVDLTGERTGDKAIGYFCYMELINGFKKSEYWTKERVIEHAKKFSKSYGNKRSAWFTDKDAMATKTVVRSLLGKYAPMSIDFVMAMSTDTINDGAAEPPQVIDMGFDEQGQPETQKRPEPDRKPDKPKDPDTEFFNNEYDNISEKPGF